MLVFIHMMQITDYVKVSKVRRIAITGEKVQSADMGKMLIHVTDEIWVVCQD